MRKWIQRAIKRPGSLTRRLHGKLGKKIIGATKSPLWTKNGSINTRTLIKFRKTNAYKKLDRRTKAQINLAITLQKIANKKRK